MSYNNIAAIYFYSVRTKDNVTPLIFEKASVTRALLDFRTEKSKLQFISNR